MARLTKEREAEIRSAMGKDCYTADVLTELAAVRAERDALLEAATRVIDGGEDAYDALEIAVAKVQR